VLTDYFIIRKRQLNLDALYEVGGEYWYQKGFHLIALISWAVGFVIFEFIAIMKYPIGGSLPSMIAAGVIYYGVTQFKRKENDR
jgi:NCS1 family nucleobase:cation symporter-1